MITPKLNIPQRGVLYHPNGFSALCNLFEHYMDSTKSKVIKMIDQPIYRYEVDLTLLVEVEDIYLVSVTNSIGNSFTAMIYKSDINNAIIRVSEQDKPLCLFSTDFECFKDAMIQDAVEQMNFHKQRFIQLQQSVHELKSANRVVCGTVVGMMGDDAITLQ